MTKGLRTALILMLAVAISAFGFAPAFAHSDEFDEFLQNEWQDTVESDYLTMHSSVYDYRSLGLEKPEVTLGDVNYDEYTESVRISQETLDKLHAFDYDELDEVQKVHYKAYENYLENLMGMYRYPELQFMFRPYTGYLSNVMDYFADFMFLEKQDVDDYLTLIAELPGYIDQMKAMTEEQAEAGFFMDDQAYSDEMYELNELIEKGEQNPMIINFEDNIDKFEGITEEERAAYKERNRELILDELIPALRDVKSFLSRLKGSRSVPTGALIEYTPENSGVDGLEYYKSLVRYYSSSDESLEEILDYLSKALIEMGDYLEWLLDEDPEFQEPASIEDLTSLEDVLSYLRENMEGFPKGPDVDYSPSFLPPGSNDFAMAYYIPAPVDNIKQNIIRVNKDNISDTNTLYFTLAHEGFPGHLYQFTWYQASEEFVPLRHELSFSGYEEGWANYVERVMMDRSGLDRTSADFIVFNEYMAYILYSGADIAVNGLGYDIDQLTEWIDSVGMNSDYADELYAISVEMPGSYIPYGYGAAKFWEFRERAEQALGNSFDFEEYHEVLLRNGPRPFSMVEEDLKAYVESKGKTLPDDFVFFAIDQNKEKPLLSGALIRYLMGAAVVLVAAVIVILINRRRKKLEKEEITESVD
ncbi:MAG: DUF885 domain-containing protein [Firmicutes bacterium]|nr:DUF885 domain-containing protein [Bacillota bacterium]